MDSYSKNTNLCLINLYWEDILFPKIFNYLNCNDLFNLRCCSREYKKMVDEFFKKGLHTLNSFWFQKELSFKTLLNNCKSLRVLTLSNVNWLTNEDLVPTLESNLNIEDLSIISCNGLTDQCLKVVIMKYKNLKSLRLVKVPWITEGALETLMQHQRHIGTFLITDWSHLSSKCVFNLCAQYKLVQVGNFLIGGCRVNHAKDCNGNGDDDFTKKKKLLIPSPYD